MVGEKKRGYSLEMLKEAGDDVVLHGKSIRGAAKRHNVPESTLRGRLSDPRGVADVRMGGPTIFTPAEETLLAEHCTSMADKGYGYTRWQIIEIACNMSQAKDKHIQPTKHWFYGFLSRNLQVKMVQPKRQEKVRNDVQTGHVTTYFAELGTILNKYSLINKPAQIWNIDETGISLDHSPPEVLSRRGCDAFSVTSGKSSTTTLVAAVSALGETIPPYIIYKGQRLTQELVSHGMPGSKFNTSLNGWVTTEIFLDLFKNHFLVHVTYRPLILLYDGHATHITMDIIETARNSDVHLFVLPPHSSHMLQPLDVSVFSPFKKSLNSEFHKQMHENPNSVITREQLPGFINTAYNSSMTVSNIMSGFRKTGIFPYNPEVVLQKPKPADPVPSAAALSIMPTRKERKDMRSIKVLFENKVSKVEEALKPNPNKKRRSTFVPPFGAAITEETFGQLLEEKNQQKVKPKQTVETRPTDEGNFTNKKKAFVTPYAKASETSISNETCEKVGTKRKGNSKENKHKGKGPAKKSKHEETCNEDCSDIEVITEDTETCMICGKIQPDGFSLDLKVQFVQWAQCEKCMKWVHLKFCDKRQRVSKSEHFFCALCL